MDDAKKHRISHSLPGDVEILALVAGYADYKAISDDRWEQGKAAGYRELGGLVAAALAPSALSVDNRQSSSNAGGVGLDAQRNIVRAVIDCYNTARPAGLSPVEYVLSKRIVQDAFAALASLSTPTAEPMGKVREAFTAGWRTNSVGPDANNLEYLDGCEEADWQEYQRSGLAFYLASVALEREEQLDTALTTPPTPDRIGKDAVRETERLRAENAALKNENERLTKAVGSGILKDLLTPDESDEFVKFIQFLREQRGSTDKGEVSRG